MFDSNVASFIDGLEFFDNYKEKIPTRMKRRSILYEIIYWENLKIVHLLDPIHILKKIHLLYRVTCHKKEWHVSYEERFYFF